MYFIYIYYIVYFIFLHIIYYIYYIILYYSICYLLNIIYYIFYIVNYILYIIYYILYILFYIYIYMFLHIIYICVCDYMYISQSLQKRKVSWLCPYRDRVFLNFELRVFLYFAFMFWAASSSADSLKRMVAWQLGLPMRSNNSGPSQFTLRKRPLVSWLFPVFGGLLHDFVFLLLGSCPFDYEASSTMLVKNGGAWPENLDMQRKNHFL